MRRNRTVYAINRYYSPATGRFTTHDPLTELDRPERLNQPQGLNLYPYVMGAPTRYTDPDGLQARSQGRDNFNNGRVFENLAESASGRINERTVFRAGRLRAGGFDHVTVGNGQVTLYEAKFTNKPLFRTFTAITTNLEKNVQEVLQEVANDPTVSRSDKQLVKETLESFRRGEAPKNLRIRVVTGKKGIGSALQARLRASTRGIRVEFESYRTMAVRGGRPSLPSDAVSSRGPSGSVRTKPVIAPPSVVARPGVGGAQSASETSGQVRVPILRSAIRLGLMRASSAFAVIGMLLGAYEYAQAIEEQQLDAEEYGFYVDITGKYIVVHPELAAPNLRALGIERLIIDGRPFVVLQHSIISPGGPCNEYFKIVRDDENNSTKVLKIDGDCGSA